MTIIKEGEGDTKGETNPYIKEKQTLSRQKINDRKTNKSPNTTHIPQDLLTPSKTSTFSGVVHQWNRNYSILQNT